jgi:rhodanese-related sulfurtransferase
MAVRPRAGATLDELVAEAVSSIFRMNPGEAAEAVSASATLIDIREHDVRRRHGVIPGALHIPRTVLEWRFVSARWRSPYLTDGQFILICDHGYSSILAAATLVKLGVDAGDVVGGFEAWRAAGLPTRPAKSPGVADAEMGVGLPGMGPPD